MQLKDGRTPLFLAARNGYEQIVQILLDKGNSSVDLAKKVILFLFLFLFFFHFLSFFYFFLHLKDGTTPFYIAAQNGHEQIVQILLDKGRANVDLADEVILLIVSFSFFFSVSHFSILFF